MVDESGAPWPYAAPPPREEEPPGTPTWACPGGECACHPPEGEEARDEHKIVLFDEEAKRMPGARCRVVYGGRLLNKDTPFADGSGAVSVKVHRGTRSLELEWAPAHVPQGPRYPFRKLYHLDLGEGREEGVERRLSNIGFSSRTKLDDNVRDFQQAYDLAVTGRPEDIEVELAGYHDDGALPPVRRGKSGDRAARFALLPDASDAKAKGAPPAGAPPPGGVKSQGSAAAVQTTRVRIELHMAFSIDPDDMAKDDDVTWDGVPYDGPALIRTLYPSASAQTWRLGARGARPVVGATLTIQGELNVPDQTAKTGPDGAAVLTLDVTGQDQNLIRIDVRMDDKQTNTTGKPAGPDLTDEKTDAPFLFRPFSLFFGVDATGALIAEQCMAMPAVPLPRFVRVISATTNGTRGGEILVDWRPDFMRCGKLKAVKERALDPKDTPVNPFDPSLARADALAKAPPGVVIHQTGTHHLSFLPGFLLDSTVEGIHYVVDYDGFVIKVLDEFYRANHAGTSVWEQKVGANHFTVGIETMHSDTTPFAPEAGQKFRVTPRRFTKEQYDAFARLLGELRARYPLTKRRVRGHMEVLVIGTSDKAPGVTAVVTNGTLSRDRVGCPGPFFEWQRLEEAGVALARGALPASAPDPSLAATFTALDALRAIPEIKAGTKSPEAKLVKQLLFDIGYSVSLTLVARDALDEVYDAPATEAVRAFQTHYFSGRRQAYTVFGPASATAPAVGTLDQRTIAAILDVWWAARTDTT
ncbi:MAG: N-acetylmuramoyl-L-alanine amidase [Byssovorax sp.]